MSTLSIPHNSTGSRKKHQEVQLRSHRVPPIEYCSNNGFQRQIRDRNRAVRQYIWSALFFCITLGFHSFGADSGLSILVVGDSNTENGYITKSLADTLGNFFDIDERGTGYVPFKSSFAAIQNGCYHDFSIQYSPTDWTFMDMFEGKRLTATPYLSPNGHWLKSAKTGAVASVKCSGTGIDAYWLSQRNGGTFSLAIDDSIYDTITSDNSSRSVHKTSINGLPAGTHTVIFKIISVPAQGNVTLLGFDARYTGADQPKRSIVHNWGNGYCTTADFLAIDSTIFVSGLQQCNPDVVVVLLGTNDHFQDRRSAPEFKTNLIALINRIKASGVTASILLTSTFMTSETTGKTYLPRYQATAWPEAASETGIEYWDMCAWFGPHNAAKMDGSLHCNPYGAKLIAAEMLNQILQRFPTATTHNTCVPSFASFPDYSIHHTAGMLLLKQQNNLPYRINLITAAGRRIASLQGYGSHMYRFSKKQVPPGVYIASMHTDSHTTQYRFAVVK